MRRDTIERLLPAAFQEAAASNGGRNALAALLDVMELLHTRAESVLDELDTLFAPDRTSYDFVPFLARWVAVDNLGFTASGTTPAERDPIPIARLRALVLEATEVAKWRGTNIGLLMTLRLATGIEGLTIEEQRPFHFVVGVPRAAADQLTLITKIVAAEKPAATTYEIAEITDVPAPEGEAS